jgi:hypothetical protein
MYSISEIFLFVISIIYNRNGKGKLCRVDLEYCKHFVV